MSQCPVNYCTLMLRLLSVLCFPCGCLCIQLLVLHGFLDVQAAAVGQPEIQFRLEDQASADSARQDLRCFVNHVESHPSEAKARNVSANPLADADGIHSNADAFGKVSSQALHHILSH